MKRHAMQSARRSRRKGFAGSAATMSLSRWPGQRQPNPFAIQRSVCLLRDDRFLERCFDGLMLAQSGVSDGGDPANASGTDRPDLQMSCYRSFFSLWNRGDQNMQNVTQLALAVACSLASAPTAIAGSAYDGSWNLAFVTRQGACEQSYDFVVNISNGIVTHPNLLKCRGHDTANGIVRASVGEK